MERTSPPREGDRNRSELEARWQAVSESSFDAIVVLDARGRIRVVSRAGFAMFGCTADRLVGEDIDRFLPGLRLSALSTLDRPEGDRESRPRGAERIALRADGSEFRVWIDGYRYGDGRKRGCVVVVRDVSPLRETELKLRQRERMLDLTIRHAPTGIATVDLQGRFLSVNRAFCSMLGHNEDELVGLPVNDITHPDDVEVAEERLEQLREGRLREYRTRKRYIRKDGEVVEGLMTACLLDDDNGRPLMYVGQVEDLTERLRAEREVRESRERLTHVTRLSTLGEMAASIAHEINQPLAAISTYALAARRMVEAGRADRAELVEVLEKIARQADRAGDVVHRLRDFVRRRSSRRELVDVVALVHDVVTLADIDVRLHDLTVRVQAEERPATVAADAVQIQQVVLNLIRNAVEAMEDPACSPRVIDVRVETRPDAYVEVSVRDRGAGIPAETEARLFTAFFTTKGIGLGLGLAISRSIIESHGGRLWFTRNEDRGVTFRLTLPSVAEENDERP